MRVLEIIPRVFLIEIIPKFFLPQNYTLKMKMTKPLTLEQIFQIHSSCVDSMLFSVLKKLSRFGFHMHLPYPEGLPGAIVSTGFILFLFSKMVTCANECCAGPE